MHRVRALSWPDLELLSDVLRKVGHDLNNAMVPALGLADIMRSRHRDSAAAPDIDRLGHRLAIFRGAAAMAVAHTLRKGQATEPALATVIAQLTAEAQIGHVLLRWHPPAGANPWPLPGLDGHLSRLLLQALVGNALQAHDRSAPPRSAAAQVDVVIDATPEGSPCLLTVQDNGPGCQDYAAAARGTAARIATGRLGIGLIVAASLAARGAGVIDIGPGPGEGFFVRAGWPSADAKPG